MAIAVRSSVLAAWVMAILPICQTLAQATDSKKQASSGFSVGESINQFQNDFAIGVHVTSPYFVKSSIAFKFSANYQWLQNIPLGLSLSKWSQYRSYRLGVVGVTRSIQNSIRLYGEGGLAIVVPNKDFSDNTHIGGYGLFGFEFFLSKQRSSYFIEMGGIGTGAIAEKSTGSPLYSNGILLSTGFRLYVTKVKGT